MVQDGGVVATEMIPVVPVRLLGSLRDVQWMARRAASHTPPDTRPQACAQVDAATWLLESMLIARGVAQCRPDPEANRIGDGRRHVTSESVWTDGCTVFEPEGAQIQSWQTMGFAEQVQWVADRLVPWARRYADGVVEFAATMFDTAVSVLDGAGVDLGGGGVEA